MKSVTKGCVRGARLNAWEAGVGCLDAATLPRRQPATLAAARAPCAQYTPLINITVRLLHEYVLCSLIALKPSINLNVASLPSYQTGSWLISVFLVNLLCGFINQICCRILTFLI